MRSRIVRTARSAGSSCPWPWIASRNLRYSASAIANTRFGHIDLAKIVPIAQHIADEGANLDLEPFVAFDERIVKIEGDGLRHRAVPSLDSRLWPG